MARFLTSFVSAAVLCVGVTTASAFPLVNGDLSDAVDLAGFTPSGNVVGEPTGDFAQLETDGTFTRMLSQGVIIPAGGATFSFDVAFSTDALAVAPGVFPDAFSAVITTTDFDLLDILVMDLFGVIADPSDGIEALTGATPIDVSFDDSVSIAGFVPFANGTNWSGRVSMLLPAEVLGDEAAIAFGLLDEPDGASTRAAIDNISLLAVRGAFEPATLGLLGLGLVGLGCARRRA